MNRNWCRWLLIAFLAIVFSVSWSCGRKNQITVNPTAMSWTDLLNTNGPTIMSGSWEQAENAYAMLRKGVYTDAELKLWIALQVEILEKTAGDPSKDELRLSAVQQMCNFPNASRPYLGWLRDSLATNRFAEKRVKEKANEALRLLGGEPSK